MGWVRRRWQGIREKNDQARAPKWPQQQRQHRPDKIEVKHMNILYYSSGIMSGWVLWPLLPLCRPGRTSRLVLVQTICRYRMNCHRGPLSADSKAKTTTGQPFSRAHIKHTGYKKNRYRWGTSPTAVLTRRVVAAASPFQAN